MKYSPLCVHLSQHKAASWAASFAEIEKILGFSLPSSASRYPAWWANQEGHGHTQTRAWMDAGWRTRKLDLQGKRVEFARQERVRPELANGEMLYAKARQLTGIEDHDTLVQEALTALVQREAAKRISRAGGSMPDLDVAPRRRWPR